MNQKKDVPSYTSSDGKIVLETVPMHGDQLFEERARNTKWTFQDGDNEFDRIEGLNPEYADWHGNVKLHEVCFFRNYFCLSCIDLFMS